jgi:hypothetical protein
MVDHIVRLVEAKAAEIEAAEEHALQPDTPGDEARAVAAE